MVTSPQSEAVLATLHNRVFLNLNQPPLHSAVDWFFQNFTNPAEQGRVCDLANTIIVLPTSRGALRLRQLLTAKAKSDQIQLELGDLVTVGELPEHLYTAQKPLASNLVQQLAWCRALSEMDDQDFTLLTTQPATERPQDWQPFASLISSLHARLSADIWSFSSVARNLQREKGFLRQELVRWEVLARLQQRYYRILNDAGLWDRHAARNYAAGGLTKANQVRCSTDKTIVMLAVADLNRSTVEMLRQVRQQNPAQVKILIAADQEQANFFDEFGGLITDRWLNTDIILKDDQIQIVDQPADQADAALAFLTRLDGFVTDEITIGVPDESIIPQIERCFNAVNVPYRSLPGRPVIDTPPIKLLKVCQNYLTTFSYEAFASLVRHPDLYDWLCRKVGTAGWLADLTAYQNNCLPHRIPIDRSNPFGDPEEILNTYDRFDPSSKGRAEIWAESTSLLNQIHLNLCHLLSDLAGPNEPMSVWVDRWKKLMISVYGELDFDLNNPQDHCKFIAIELLFRALESQSKIPNLLQSSISSIQSLQFCLREMTDLRIPPLPHSTAVELAGWLDLMLDDAPVVVVTGMNDGFVPTSERSHPFLPNELCKTLKILDDDRRHARDCYALTVMAKVRRHLLLIAGRRDTGGEPLKPSRLLFSDRAEVAAGRAKSFFEFAGAGSNHFWLADPQKAPNHSRFSIPQPGDFKPLTQMTVTRFRDYLKCPFRFYLKHVLRLESVRDDARELDAGQFGDLAHNCLEVFGKSDVRDSIRPKEILGFLNDQLNRFSGQMFTDTQLPAVKIQLAQIRQRFEVFAKLQALHRAEGWRIVSTEEMLEHEFDVDGTPFLIRGKIDRIDQHEGTGQIAIWDYKTSDKGDGPGGTHYRPRKKEWKDLQLPLYRHLIKEVEVVAGGDLKGLTLGYIILPRRLEDIRFEVAEWNDELLDSADEVARSVIRCLRESIFWPPVPEPPEYSEEFAVICQDHVFGN